MSCACISGVGSRNGLRSTAPAAVEQSRNPVAGAREGLSAARGRTADRAGREGAASGRGGGWGRGGASRFGRRGRWGWWCRRSRPAEGGWAGAWGGDTRAGHNDAGGRSRPKRGRAERGGLRVLSSELGGAAGGDLGRVSATSRRGEDLVAGAEAVGDERQVQPDALACRAEERRGWGAAGARRGRDARAAGRALALVAHDRARPHSLAEAAVEGGGEERLCRADRVGRVDDHLARSGQEGCGGERAEEVAGPKPPLSPGRTRRTCL